MSLSVAVRARLSPAFTLDVAFLAPPGITIVFGASGSGKSTLLRSVAGLFQPDAGSIALDRRILFDAATARNVPTRRRNIGYVCQHLALFPHMSVGRNLEYGLHGVSAATRRERVHAIAERFRIAHLLSRRPAAISGGEGQRAALARSLVTDPALLLLDEPLSALDHATLAHIMDDLRAWNAAHRVPILYVTHAHREVFALGERVIVLKDGRVAATGTPHDVMDMPADEGLAQLAGFENVFTGTILAKRPDLGTMRCQLVDATDRGADLEVPLSRSEVGAPVRIAIRAGDILVATEPPRGLSARNIFAGRLVSLVREAATTVAAVDAGGRFVVHLTPGSSEALGLAVGGHVWLIVKTHSCRIVSG